MAQKQQPRRGAAVIARKAQLPVNPSFRGGYANTTSVSTENTRELSVQNVQSGPSLNSNIGLLATGQSYAFAGCPRALVKTHRQLLTR